MECVYLRARCQLHRWSVFTCTPGVSYTGGVCLLARQVSVTQVECVYLRARCQLHRWSVFTCAPGVSYTGGVCLLVRQVSVTQVECVYLRTRCQLHRWSVFTCAPGVSYSRQFRSLLLCLCDVLQVLRNSLWLLILKTKNGQQQNFPFTQSLDTIPNMKTRIAESLDMLWLLPKECCCSNTSWSIYYREVVVRQGDCKLHTEKQHISTLSLAIVLHILLARHMDSICFMLFILPQTTHQYQ